MPDRKCNKNEGKRKRKSEDEGDSLSESKVKRSKGDTKKKDKSGGKKKEKSESKKKDKGENKKKAKQKEKSADRSNRKKKGNVGEKSGLKTKSKLEEKNDRIMKSKSKSDEKSGQKQKSKSASKKKEKSEIKSKSGEKSKERSKSEKSGKKNKERGKASKAKYPYPSFVIDDSPPKDDTLPEVESNKTPPFGDRNWIVPDQSLASVSPEVAHSNRESLRKIIELLKDIRPEQVNKTNKDDLDKIQAFIKNIRYRDSGELSRIRQVSLTEQQKLAIRTVAGKLEEEEGDEPNLTSLDGKQSHGDDQVKINFAFGKLNLTPTKQ